MGKTKKHIVFLQDMSGSMATIWQDTIGGFNAFLETEKKSNPDVKFSFTLFEGSNIENRHVRDNIANVKPLNENTYIPGGSTPLFDAIMRTVHKIEAVGKKKESVLFVISTDGQENSSHEFTSSDVKSAITKKEKEGWKFVYLGVGIDDFSESQGLGIASNYHIDAASVRGVYASMNQMSTSYFSTGDVVLESEGATEIGDVAPSSSTSINENVTESPIVVSADPIGVKRTDSGKKKGK